METKCNCAEQMKPLVERTQKHLDEFMGVAASQTITLMQLKKLLGEYVELADLYDNIFNDHELEERAMFRDLFQRTRQALTPFTANVQKIGGGDE